MGAGFSCPIEKPFTNRRTMVSFRKRLGLVTQPLIIAMQPALRTMQEPFQAA